MEGDVKETIEERANAARRRRAAYIVDARAKFVAKMRNSFRFDRAVAEEAWVLGGMEMKVGAKFDEELKVDEEDLQDLCERAIETCGKTMDEFDYHMDGDGDGDGGSGGSGSNGSPGGVGGGIAT